MITNSRNISPHFHSSEFRCQHCGAIKIEEELVNKLEQLFSKLNASKCIISSGYRCSVFDKQIGGFLGRHYEGLASDCVYYDKSGNMIPSVIVCCVANDLGIFNGIARIDNYYVHLDNRKGYTYKGDEPRGNSSYWSDPYAYFGVSRSAVNRYTGSNLKSIDEVAREVINRKYGDYPERKIKLEAEGYDYRTIQNRVNEILRG